MPQDNEAIWHINPTGEASTQSHVVQAGEEDGKYVASTLNDTHEHHGVRASLIIANPSLEDLEHLNYLEVITPKGTQRYNFSLELRTSPVPEPSGEPGEKENPNVYQRQRG